MRPGLLVIDNCEHQIDAARDLVDTILAACPRLTVLTTSREPLGLADESVFRLPPLPLPAPRPGAGDGRRRSPCSWTGPRGCART